LHPAVVTVAAVAVHLTVVIEYWHCGAQREFEARAESERPKGRVGAADRAAVGLVVAERVVGTALSARPGGHREGGVVRERELFDNLLRRGAHALALDHVMHLVGRQIGVLGQAFYWGMVILSQ
jgi:hypothetical protein